MNRINLAHKPFTNRTLPWAATALILFVSLVAFAVILRSSSKANREAATIQADLRNLRQEVGSLEQQANQVKQSLSPEQLAMLKAAHDLVDRKHFSWTRLFVDLEAALPGTVRVTRISVRDVLARPDQTIAELELAVIAKSPNVITEMISVMDRNGVFQAELRNQNLQKGRGETGAEYELYVIYRPRAGAPAGENQPPELAQIGVEPVNNEVAK